MKSVVTAGCPSIFSLEDFCKQYVKYGEEITASQRVIVEYLPSQKGRAISAIIYIPAHTSLEHPFDLSTVLKDINAYEIHVVVDTGASVTILDIPSVVVGQVEQSVVYHVGHYARLTIQHQYHGLPDTHAHSITIIRAQAQSVVCYGLVTTGGGTTRSTLLLELIGEYAHVEVQGVYMHRDHEVVTFITRQHHQAPHTYSKVTINGSLDDHAHMSFDGRIILGAAARHAQAHQRNETFLLAPTAGAHSEPTIEVLNNEVQCTHASAMGKLDAQQVAYMASRGLSPAKARCILLVGCLTKTVSNHARLAELITAFQKQAGEYE